MLLFPSENIVIQDLLCLYDLYNGLSPFSIDEFLKKDENNRARRPGVPEPDLYNHHIKFSIIRRQASLFSWLSTEITSLPRKQFHQKLVELALQDTTSELGKLRVQINNGQYCRRKFKKFEKFKIRISKQKRMKKMALRSRLKKNLAAPSRK